MFWVVQAVSVMVVEFPGLWIDLQIGLLVQVNFKVQSVFTIATMSTSLSFNTFMRQN